MRSLAPLLIFGLTPMTWAVETIPLDQVLGHLLPGTRELSEVDPNSHDLPHYEKPTTTSAYGKLVWALAASPKGALQNAFVVSGSPLEALERAAQLISENGDPTDCFSTEDDLYLVFFCRMSSRYVSLDRITKGSRTIEIVYRQHTHMTADLTVHCALIPLGRLEPGQQTVVIKQLSTQYDEPEGRVRPDRADDSRVCRPTTFTVSPTE